MQWHLIDILRKTIIYTSLFDIIYILSFTEKLDTVQLILLFNKRQ